MGDTALDTPEVEQTEGEVEVVLDDEPKDGDVTPEGEESEASEETPEVEVVRQGVDGSQPKKKQPGIKKLIGRIGKLNEQNAAITEEAGAETNRANVAEERAALLQIALDQKNETEAIKKPDPNDFDEGTLDPKFIEADSAFTQSYIDSQVEKRVAQLPAPQAEATNTDLLKVQTKHYDEAEKFGAKDYGETEDVVIESIGNNAVNAIIQVSDNPHVILYFLGKNPDELESFKDLLVTNPGKAVSQIGRLDVELKVQPKGKSQHAPDPDEELEGGSPSAGNSKELKVKKQLEDLRTAVSKGDKTFSDLIAFKKKALADGVTL